MAEPPKEELKRMTLGEHLEELRKRVMWGGGALVLAVIASLFVQDYLVAFAKHPYDVARAGILIDHPEVKVPEQFIFTNPGEPFFVYLKLGLVAGLFAASPFILWQMWLFVAAGLYARERKALLTYIPVSLALFATGAAFGYFVVLPLGLRFLLAYSVEALTPMIDLDEYIGFFLLLTLVFGAVFELPLVMAFLSKTGLVKPETYRKHWRAGILVITIASAALTPPDPYTMIAMLVPLLLLYEFGIWAAKAAARKTGNVHRGGAESAEAV